MRCMSLALMPGKYRVRMRSLREPNQPLKSARVSSTPNPASVSCQVSQ